MDTPKGDRPGGEKPDRKQLAGSLERLEGYLYELRQERDAANRALAAQAEHVDVLVHEARAELAAVAAFADLLLGGELDPKQGDHAQQLKACVTGLSDRLDAIAASDAAGDAGLPLEPQEFAFHDLIVSIGRQVTARCRAKGLQSTITITGDIPDMLSGDRARVGQVLSILTDNAVRFTQRGSILLHVERLAAPDDEVRLRFSVRDSGIGMTDEMRAGLFAPAEEEAAPGHAQQGGLAIARRLVALLSGKIGCDSILGEGSIFWFTTPLKPVEMQVGQDEELSADDAAAYEAAPFEPPVPDGAPRPAHVLVVDSNRIDQMLVTTYLTKFGYTFSVADDGRDAVQAVQREYFDIILTDLNLPDMDGLQLGETIRALGGWREAIPMIAVTRNSLHVRRKAYLEAGMDSCLTKPIDAMQLFSVMSKHLKHAGAAPRVRTLRANNDDADLFQGAAGLA